MPETKNKKTVDFNEWYNEIVELADLCDKRYPIKGMNIWRPYGWKLMNHVDQLIRDENDEIVKVIERRRLLPAEKIKVEIQFSKTLKNAVTSPIAPGAIPGSVGFLVGNPLSAALLKGKIKTSADLSV